MDRDSSGPGHKVYSNRKDESSFSTAGSRIELLRENILQSWLQKVHFASRDTRDLQSHVITPYLQEFLDQLTDSLNDPEPDRKLKEFEQALIRTTQSLEESTVLTGDLVKIIDEFQALQQSLLDLLEQEGPLQSEERNLILSAISSGIKNVTFKQTRSQRKSNPSEDLRLRESEESLRFVVESIQDHAIIRLNSQGQIVDWNPGAERIFGYTRGEILNRGTELIFNEEDRRNQIHLKEMIRADATGSAEDERWHIRKDGTQFFASGILNPLRSVSGELLGYVKVLRDSTGRKLEEQATESQQLWLQCVLERIPLAVVLADPVNGEVLFSNHEASRLTGNFPIHLVSEEIGGYFATDSQGRRIPIPDMPRFRISRGEKIKNLEVIWHRHGNSTPLLVNGELIPEMFGHPSTVLLILQDISEQVAARKALEQSEEHFRALADALPQLVWTAREDGSIDYFNKRWLEYTGTSDVPESREKWLSLIHPEDRPETQRVWGDCLRTGKQFTREHRVQCHDGLYHWFLVLAVPIADSEGRIIKWFGTLTDIDEQKKFSENLEHAKSLAEAASAAKSSFLANVSHEIRTPLGAIMGFTDLLKDPSLDAAEKRDYLDVIERNGQALTRILDDVLDLSKVEAGHLQIEDSDFSLYALIDEAMTLFQDRAASKGLMFEKSVNPGTPDKIRSDPTRLRQILVNIIGNAIKFTSRGGVRIQVEIKNQTPLQKGSKSLFQIHVIDTGPGLTSEQAELLFQPFTQADNSVTRRFGGTGLGLALSRRLAQALGGDVRISKCEPEVGCTFTITFLAEVLESLRDNPHSVEPAQPRNRSNGSLLHTRVLVVDDSSDNRLLISQFLKREGAELEEAENGLEAIDKALQSDFDLVLMDIQMPVLDGHRAVQKLRECGYHKPVLALTAHAMKEEMDKALSSGFDDYLTKPLNLKKLIEKVGKFSKKPIH